MYNHISPWMQQLNRVRPLYILETDVATDICIVGGGISGVMTAYQILKNTDKKIVLVDAHKIGHGATGHNAGQLVSELERSVVSLVGDFGLQKTVEALNGIHSSWTLLEEIIQEANIDVPYSTFEGYNVYSTRKQIQEKLADIALMREGDIHVKKIYISEQHVDSLELDKSHMQYVEIIPHESILSLSGSIDTQYIAAHPQRKGCLNSALLTEALTLYLQATYGIQRFQVYEETPIVSIDLDLEHVAIITGSNKTIAADKVILCTNGFEHFKIRDVNEKIEFSFHKNVKGNVGYMMARTEELSHAPSAFAYFDKSFDDASLFAVEHHIDITKDVVYGGEYVYSTRRPYDLGHDEPKNLFCIGGKGFIMEDTSTYGKNHVFNPDIKKEYDKFMLKTFSEKDNQRIDGDKEFIWHGLMGYTSNGLRMVGFEKRNNKLMYNLGCNGVGIMPAIWGAKRIAALLNGDTSTSIFDPSI